MYMSAYPNQYCPFNMHIEGVKIEYLLRIFKTMKKYVILFRWHKPFDKGQSLL